MSGSSFNANLFAKISEDAKQYTKEKHFKLFGNELVAKQPDLDAFRQAQRGNIKDETNPDEVEAAAADVDGALYRMILLCVRDLEGNQVFPDVQAIKKLPVHDDVANMINAVTEVANFESLVKEETGNSEETQSDAQSSN